MNSVNRRFIFIDFNALLQVKLEQLEQICERIVIFLDEHVREVPLPIVMKIQKLGKRVKWITATPDEQLHLDLHLAFSMGRVHQKTDATVEFVIISNNISFDALVEYLNEMGRPALRVQFDELKNGVDNSNDQIIQENDQDKLQYQAVNDTLMRAAAQETLSRLVRSGNRPAHVDILRHYIVLNNHNNEQIKNNADVVIEKMVEMLEIAIEGKEVQYNF